MRALENDRPRCSGDFGVRATHHPREGYCSLGIGDDEHVRRQFTAFPVERLQHLTRSRRPYANLAAAKPGVVERVHGLTEFEQHVIGHVDDIAGRPDAFGAQTRLHPLRRRPDRHIRHGAGVAWTQPRALDDVRRYRPDRPSSATPDEVMARSLPRRDAATWPRRAAVPADQTRWPPRERCRSPTCSRDDYR